MLALVAREHDKLATADLSSVKIAAMGSAPVSMTLFNDVAKLFPSATVVTNYGTTEAGARHFRTAPKGDCRVRRSRSAFPCRRSASA